MYYLVSTSQHDRLWLTAVTVPPCRHISIWLIIVSCCNCVALLPHNHLLILDMCYHSSTFLPHWSGWLLSVVAYVLPCCHISVLILCFLLPHSIWNFSCQVLLQCYFVATLPLERLFSGAATVVPCCHNFILLISGIFYSTWHMINTLPITFVLIVCIENHCNNAHYVFTISYSIEIVLNT